MKAVVYEKPGDESVLKIGEVADPKAGPGQLLIRVKYAGLNRADLMQRQGFYPPPPGASEIIGMECAGEVAAVGAGVSGWRVGERAMALLAGGGYAELAAVDSGSAMKIPASMSDEEGAAFPEVFLTAFLNIFMLAEAKPGDSVLVHGGGSGVGTASILLCKEAGVRSIVTAGNDAKCEQCLKLGADVAINYNSGPFPAAVKTATNGRGADVILDSIGAAYLGPNLEALAHGGRLVLIGLMKGARTEIDLTAVLRRHLDGDRLDAAQPPGKGEGANRRRVARAFRCRARSRPPAPADLQGRTDGERGRGASDDGGERALRKNRSAYRVDSVSLFQDNWWREF